MFFLFIIMHFLCCICANGCKWVQIHALLHINAPPKKESCPQLFVAKLPYIHITKGDKAM